MPKHPKHQLHLNKCVSTCSYALVYCSYAVFVHSLSFNNVRLDVSSTALVIPVKCICY